MPNQENFEPIRREVLPELVRFQSLILGVYESGTDVEAVALLEALENCYREIRAEFTSEDLQKSVHWHALIGSGLPASAEVHATERENLIGAHIIEILKKNLPAFLID